MAGVHLLVVVLLCLPCLSLSLSDADALLLLKSSFQNGDVALSSWSSESPCSSEPRWAGVLCFDGIVTGLRLGNLGLTGTINVDALTHIPALRTISFVNNSLSGPFPDFSRLDALKSLYLSDNGFSGPVPDGLFSPLDHLKKLWIDGNRLSGAIPASLSKARALLELHIEGNHFAGSVPDLDLPLLRSFNASGNDLSGPVPASLARFGGPAFMSNEGMCGPPTLGPACPPKEGPSKAPDPVRPPNEGSSRAPAAVFGFAVLTLLMLLVAGLVILLFRWQGRIYGMDSDASVMEKGLTAAIASASPGSNKRRESVRGPGGTAGGGGGALVMVNKEREALGLPDLMKSAAEVLGNGSLGSAYKAVMAGGSAVVVKRMRELNRVDKDGFDAELRRFGRFSHPNILTPLAYHFRKDEKLIVSDYVPKGSLLYLLHGERGTDRAALDWATRLKIVLGIARGMAYLHGELTSYEIPHGNLKSANVLLSSSCEPLLCDYGLITLLNPALAPAVLFSFRSPEAIRLRHVSPKSDVFCFGLVLLEILTGKFPSQYLNNTKGGADLVQWTASALSEAREAELIDPSIAPPTIEMLSLLRLAAACTLPSPDDRPDMKEASDLVEDIAAAAAHPSADSGSPSS